MKRLFFGFTAAMLIGAMTASIAMAQRPRQNADLDFFMQKHPWVAKRLAHDPALADNPEFLAKHPAFKNFMAHHPDTREQIPAAVQRYAQSPGAPGVPNP